MADQGNGGDMSGESSSHARKRRNIIIVVVVIIIVITLFIIYGGKKMLPYGGSGDKAITESGELAERPSMKGRQRAKEGSKGMKEEQAVKEEGGDSTGSEQGSIGAKSSNLYG